MGIFRRAGAVQPDIRTIGLEAAVGIENRIRTHTRPAGSSPSGLTCATCAGRGRVDIIDMTVRRAYITCPGCERTWDTDRDRVPRRAFLSGSQ